LRRWVDVKTLTCIVCPTGCRITAEMRDGKYVFSGNRCAKGLDFAKAELTAPMRSLSTTVRTTFHEAPVLPVKTKGEVPKEMIPGIIRILARLSVSEKIGIGETVAANILGSGCDVIATSNLLKSVEEKEESPCPIHSY
jgi:CxxC motif-containing protein